MEVHSHRDLIVWQKSVEFVQHIYKVTSSFPKSEQFGLISQLRRAAVSVPANIAEGRARSTRKDFSNFLTIARGSLMECDTFIVICRNLNYLKSEDARQLSVQLTEISKMINALRTSLATKN